MQRSSRVDEKLFEIVSQADSVCHSSFAVYFGFGFRRAQQKEFSDLEETLVPKGSGMLGRLLDQL